MGKLNTALIDGFDTMSVEQKLEALLGMEVPDEVDMSKYVDATIYNKLKTANDRNSSELADMKKKMNAKMTDDERIKADAEAAQKELQEKYDALLKESTIGKYVAKYVAQGYDQELAQKTAEALFSGDMDTVFANGEKFRDQMVKNAKADALRDTPRPGAGEPSDGQKKLSQDEQIASDIGKRTAAYNQTTSDVLKNYL